MGLEASEGFTGWLSKMLSLHEMAGSWCCHPRTYTVSHHVTLGF